MADFFAINRIAGNCLIFVSDIFLPLDGAGYEHLAAGIAALVRVGWGDVLYPEHFTPTQDFVSAQKSAANKILFVIPA